LACGFFVVLFLLSKYYQVPITKTVSFYLNE
jgi:hypothetical protein